VKREIVLPFFDFVSILREAGGLPNFSSSDNRFNDDIIF